MNSSSNLARRLPFAPAQPAEDPFNLAGVALSIASDEYPNLDVRRYLSLLDDGVIAVRQRLGGSNSPLDALREVSNYLFVEAGFFGNLDDYYDPRNSYLNEVLDRRAGNPLTLSILFLELGWRMGLPLEGVAYPGHFLVKCACEDGTLVLDPFFRGQVLDEAELLRRVRRVSGSEHTAEVLPMLLKGCTKREIVVRLLRNLKEIYSDRQDHPRLVRVADQLCQYAPAAAEERRDRGLAYLALKVERAALRDLSRYLELRPGADDAPRIHELVVELSGRIKPVH